MSAQSAKMPPSKETPSVKLGRKDPEQPPPSPITPDMTSSAPAAATTSRNKRSSPLGFSKKNQKLASKVAQVESLESELADAKAQIAAHVEEISSLRAELERQTEEAGEWQIQALNLENENASMSSTIDAMTHNRKAKDQALMDMGERMIEMETKMDALVAERDAALKSAKPESPVPRAKSEKVQRPARRQSGRARLLAAAAVPLTLLAGGLGFAMVAALKPMPALAEQDAGSSRRNRDCTTKDDSMLGTWVPESSKVCERD
mmetsp:Transcript_24254/g.61030  ORF Transcript_24254/g.61030 Transcript_24254/m.61030 type:complete len:262 (-) Transcript_24254:181-966(-)